MNHHIAGLENSGSITDCEGSWGSLFLLAAKSHQDNCFDINTFIWRLYVSYRPLNSITRSFECPILRCVNSIEDISNSCGSFSMISFDARSGYHQAKVQSCDQDKLVFFTPCVKKKTFKVVIFSPKNAPTLYTTMMQTFREFSSLLCRYMYLL